MTHLEHLDLDYYKRVRKAYEPEPKDLEAIFIFESPPKEGDYFYETNYGETYNGPGPFFYAIMRLVMDRPTPPTPRSCEQKRAIKVAGLCAFRDKGYLLLDATYTPINGKKLSNGKMESEFSKPQRRQIVHTHISSVFAELRKYAKTDTKVIVAMMDVCKELVKPLKDDGNFNVMNAYGQNIPFPLGGGNNERNFAAMVRPMLGLGPLKR